MSVELIVYSQAFKYGIHRRQKHIQQQIEVTNVQNTRKENRYSLDLRGRVRVT